MGETAAPTDDDARALAAKTGLATAATAGLGAWRRAAEAAGAAQRALMRREACMFFAWEEAGGGRRREEGGSKKERGNHKVLNERTATSDRGISLSLSLSLSPSFLSLSFLEQGGRETESVCFSRYTTEFPPWPRSLLLPRSPSASARPRQVRPSPSTGGSKHGERASVSRRARHLLTTLSLLSLDLLLQRSSLLQP